MRRTFALFSFLIGLAGTATPLHAADSVAIGYFSRRVDTPLSREIILRFPIFLSKTYARTKRGSVIYPHEFSKRRMQLSIANSVLYSAKEYQKLKPAIENGILITGEMFEYEEKKREKGASDEIENSIENPLDKKHVIVKLYCYNAQTERLTTLRISSKPETVVIDMVKRVVLLEKDRYLEKPILPKSRVAVMASVDNIELNAFYMHLLEKNYSVSALSGDDLMRQDFQDFDRLRDIRSRTLSYESTVDLKDEPRLILSAAADNEARALAYNEFQTLRDKAQTHFEKTLKGVLSKIRERTQADYLLLFHPDGRSSFARGFDLQTGSLVWFQDSFPSKSSSTEDVLNTMVDEMQRPLKTLDEIQFAAIAAEKDKMSSRGADGELANVAILDFYDKTASPLYLWLSSSLSTAVDDSMKKIFEYNRSDEKTSNGAGARFFKTPQDVSAARLKDFYKATGADYLIFGFYTIDKKTGLLVIESKVFDLVREKQIGGSTNESPVDVSLFNAVDEISQGIVQDIFTMTQQRNN